MGLLSLIQTNALSSVVLESLGQKAERVGKKAQLAGETADAAIIKSAQATSASGDAVSTSNKAEGAASNALVLARGARKEADSFEKDIVSAKKQATEAEAHLAEAMQRAANAENEANTLRGQMVDRVITPAQRGNMLRILRTRAPGHIILQSVLAGGRESLQYAGQIADVFRDDAHWDVTAPTGMGSMSYPVSGVFLVVGPESDELVDFVARVLIAGEIATAPLMKSLGSNRAAGTIEIWVASRAPIQ